MCVEALDSRAVQLHTDDTRLGHNNTLQLGLAEVKKKKFLAVKKEIRHPAVSYSPNIPIG